MRVGLIAMANGERERERESPSSQPLALWPQLWGCMGTVAQPVCCKSLEGSHDTADSGDVILTSCAMLQPCSTNFPQTSCLMGKTLRSEVRVSGIPG